jgi:hypothetical protein
MRAETIVRFYCKVTLKTAGQFLPVMYVALLTLSYAIPFNTFVSVVMG